MKLTKRDFLLFLIIIYFTFIGGTYYSQLNLWLRLANQLFATGILVAWLVGKLRQEEGWPRTALDWPLAAYLGVNLVSAFLGQSPRYSLEMMWFTVIHLLAFYLLVDLIRRGWTARLVWAFYMASAVVCLVALAEFMAWYVGTPLFANFSQGWLEIGGWRNPIPPYIYRLAITLNGSTPLSAYLALLTPPALGLILTLPRRDENRKALMVWLVLALIVQILTFSRAGVLALGVSLSLLLVGWRQVSGKAWSGWERVWSQISPGRRLVLIAGSVVVAGAGLFWLQNSFANRMGSTNFRLTLWQAALTIFQEQPFSGAGPTNFGRALLRLNEEGFPRLQITTAHNIYLNTAAELGLLGLLVGAALFWGVGWNWWQRWQQNPSQTERIRLMACGAALIGLAAQTLVDTYMATPNMLVMLALVAYIVAGVKPVVPAERQSYLGRNYPLYLGLVTLLVYLAGFWGIVRADLRFNSSFRQQAGGKLEDAAAQAQRAQELDPGLALRSFRLAFLEAQLAHQTGDPAWLGAAIEHYRAGLKQEPILGLNSANLAGLLWQQGERAEAIRLLEQTIVVEPDPLYLVNLGYFYEQQGDKVQASQAYGQALVLNPALAGSGFWQATPERAELWPQVVEAALASPLVAEETSRQRLSVQLALAREAWEAIERFVQAERQTLDQETKRALAEFYLAQNQPQQAAAVLEPEPESAEAYALWGRIALLSGDEVMTEKRLKTAIFLGNREANYYLGRLFEQQGKLEAAALAYQRAVSIRSISENIEVTIYGRLGRNDLAPQLLRMGLGQRQAQPLLALAQLRQAGGQFEEARRIYQLLLDEDPFLEPAQEGLAALESRQLSR